ncbi:MAG: hypothetical protein ACQESR_13675 [Planctomycetota bacterium]
MESCPTQAVLPLVGLAAEKVIRDRYKVFHQPGGGPPRPSRDYGTSPLPDNRHAIRQGNVPGDVPVVDAVKVAPRWRCV